jgi:2-polyprenyl-3-methyl-5-hydroxy-6-metoxy-1,4-benzoquinol methylase
MKWYARFVLETYNTYTNKMGPYSVLDIGCNDGSQLDAFKELLFKTHGVDPAENLYPTSSAKHNVVCGFWNPDSASKLGQEFDVITTQNAFAHIPDPLSYLKLAKTYLKTDGKIFISTSQADMVVNGEFDTIYHEHISYYNAESMKALAERAGLYLIDVVKTPIHGTSYIFVLSKQPKNRERIENILATEARIHNGSTYTTWVEQTKQLLQQIRVTVDAYKDQGFTIVGYGAAAKGMTLLNASRVHMDVVVDDNPLKQGLYCPGTTIPVVSSDYIKNLEPSTRVLFVPLAWNFYSEIARKIAAIRSNPADIYMRYFPTVAFDMISQGPTHDHQH